MITIDEQFQSSVNLLIDIYNEEKIRGYIPLRPSVEILKRYLRNVLENRREKSTMLIGPYGKGKSHLLLVLLNILQQKSSRELVEKIGRTDKEAGRLIERFGQQGKKMLPVILTNTGESLNQTFLLALSQALKDAGLNHMMPDTYYQEAIKVIYDWKECYPDTYRNLNKQLRMRRIRLDFFLRKLEQFDERYMTLFQEIYPVLTSGSSFNPMINMSVMALYRDMNRLLCKTQKYAGTFIVFDEFSKYIEGNTKENVSTNMKIIQDMCEMCNGLDEYPMHLVFVAHKSIKEYRDVLPDKVLNAFRGVEGRIQEILFLSSEKNNFGLIGSVIKKDENLFNEWDRKHKYIEKCEDMWLLPCFRSRFVLEEFKRDVIYGCFPMTPTAAYLLLHISERVAQNERTLFTYLAKDEPGSLFCRIKHEEEIRTVHAGCVYDYFSVLLKEEGEASSIHHEWLKAEYALSKAESEAEDRLIKSLALILIINCPEEIPADRPALKDASGLSTEEFEEGLSRLEKKQLIIYRSRIHAYTFKNNVGINLQEEISKTAKLHCQSIDQIDAVKEVCQFNYLLPRRYNVDFTMTRYFEYCFMTDQMFLNLNQTAALFEESPSDGKLIAIFAEQPLRHEQILAQLERWKDPRIAVLSSSIAFEGSESLRKLSAVRMLMKNEQFIEDNRVLEQELKLYEEDLIFDINQSIGRMFLTEYGNCTVYIRGREPMKGLNRSEFNRLLSELCRRCYGKAPRVNSELINRRHLSPQIRRVRAKVIDSILKKEDDEKYQRGTNPESAIFRAVFFGTGILKRGKHLDPGTESVLKEIRDFVHLCEGKAVSFSRLYAVLEGMSYGVRRGIIPVLTAYVMSEFQDMPVIYLNRREIQVNGECLSRIDDEPRNYALYVEKNTAKKENYLYDLEKLFGQERAGRNVRLQNLAETMKRWYRGLCRYTMVCRGEDWWEESVCLQIEKVRKVFQKMELNPREFIFEELPRALSVDEGDYEAAGRRLGKVKERLDVHIEEVKQHVIRINRQAFNCQSGSLCFGLKEWYEILPDRLKNQVLSRQYQEVMNYIKDIQVCDDKAVTEKMARLMVDLYIEDWGNETMALYEKELDSFIRECSEKRNRPDTEQDSILTVREDGQEITCYYKKSKDENVGYFLKNAVENVLEDFGTSMDEGEKIAVLVDVIRRLGGIG